MYVIRIFNDVFSVVRPIVIPAVHNVTVGSKITFDCNITSEFGSPPFSYRWFMRSFVSGSDTLLGDTDKSYTIASTMHNSARKYFCEVNNSLSNHVNSTPANLFGKN